MATQTFNDSHDRHLAKSVLVIDDDDDFRNYISENLRSLGARIDVTSTPEEAAHLMAQNEYQVIVTDINHYNSPISGDAFILQNKERLKDSAFIVFSGNGLNNIEHSRELEELKIPILAKGGDFQKLTELIKQRLEETESTPTITELNIPPGFEIIHDINESAGWIGQVCWSPDGKRITAQTSSKGVLLWDRETEKAVFIDSNTNPTGGMTWSPDGKTLAYTSKKNVLLFDTEQMKGNGSVDDKTTPDQLGPGLSWSPDGKSLAIGNRNGVIHVYATAGWSRIKSFEGSKDWTFTLTWSPDSSTLASGGDDNEVRLWDLATGESQNLAGHTDQITCLAWSPNGELLASGSADKSICVWNPLTKTQLKVLQGHTGRITSISFSFDGSLLASKSNDGTIKLWRSDSWELVTTLEEKAEIPGGLYTPSVAFHPHELILATLGNENARIRIWKLKAAVLFKPDEESILSASVSDQPTPLDNLGFAPYVRALARFLTDERTQPPLTLSIEGEWGCGKSSFMLQLEDELRRASQQRRIRRILKLRWLIRMRRLRIPPPISNRRWWGRLWPLWVLPREERYPTFVSVRFNAWRHDKDSSLWASFALALLRKLPRELPAPLRAWARLKLAARRYKWADGWLVMVRTMLITVAFVALSLTLFHFLYTGGVEKIFGKATEAKGGETFLVLVKGSGVFGSLAIFLYLLTKLKEIIGNPFTSDLKKYLKTPGYDSQIAFIEQFHEDFGKIVETFAGKNKVYVFIDDLDRCEVPRAAELMQAINLLISDSPQVFFIVGMDREKVAAGLAVKYEKLLPYLYPPISNGKSLDTNADPKTIAETGGFDSSGGMEFGYSFIEKFIQIPFRIPQPGEKGLTAFLDDISPMIGQIKVTEQSTPNPQVLGVISSGETDPRLTQPVRTIEHQKSTVTRSPVAQTPATPITTEQEERRERIRIAVTKDSTTVRNIVQMVAPTLDYNPRRVKQFINMFRLKALIAAETGLFDAPKSASKDKGLTLQQLGKFVAVSLKWPRLLADLDDDNGLLAELQNWACQRSHQVDPFFSSWMYKPDLKALLVYGCLETQDPFDQTRLADHSRYDLSNINLQSLLRISPQVRPTQSGPQVIM
jgi:WD40 repeat protein